MADLRSIREERFERVSRSLENLRALVNQLLSRVELFEDGRLDSSTVNAGGRPVSAHSGVRTDPQPFPSAGQIRYLDHIAD